MKYELTDETIAVCGRILHRVRYLETGELGGWIERENNLSQDGEAQVCGDAQVYGNALVSGKARVSGDARVSGKARVCGEARVSGKAWVSGKARVSGDARVSGKARVSGDAWVYGDAQVYGNALVSGKARVSGDAWETSPLQIQGTKFFFSVSSKDCVTVGCHVKTIAEWQETYEAEFDDHEFTAKERREYKLYFNLASALYGWGVTLPVEEEKQ